MKLNRLLVFMVFAVVTCILAVGTVSAASNNATGPANSAYPTYQVDNQHTGQSEYNGPKTNTTKWEKSAGTGAISVIGSDGTIYFGTMLGSDVKAYYPNGTEKWTTTLSNLRGFAIGNDETLYVLRSGGFSALDSNNGALLWNSTIPAIGSDSNPIIGSDGTIYFGTNSGFFAINPDGSPKWNSTITGGVATGGPVIGLDGTVYIRASGMLYALDPDDGSQKWAPINLGGGRAPAIGADGTIYVTGNTNILYALNPEDGSQKWSYTASSYINIPVIASDGTIYIACNDGKIYALTDNGNDATVKWTYEGVNGNYAVIVMGADGTIYTGNGNSAGTTSTHFGSVFALTPDGILKWSYNMGLPPSLIMIGSDGTLHVICSGSASKFWAFQDFVADFSVDAAGDLTVGFTDKSSNLPTTWLWDFGDGNTSDVQNPTHTYSNPGTYTVSLMVFNGDGEMRTVTKEVTVVKTNSAPVLDFVGNKSVSEGQTLNFSVGGSDPDGDNLTYNASGLPDGAAFNPTTREFSWTPGSGQAGSYQVTFTVSDGSLTDSETITISVDNVNRPPILDVSDKTVNENEALNFNLNGSDPDGDSLSYTATGLPTGANLNMIAGMFSWTPTYAQAGTYQITFTVNDGTVTTSKTINITVNNVNRPPVIDVSDKTVNENQALNFTVGGSDPDSDDVLTYTATGLPTGATIDQNTGLFSWIPTFDQAGSYQVTFTVSDGNSTASKTVTITVNDVDNIAPNVTKVDPAKNAMVNSVDMVIKVTFNEVIKAGNLWIDLKNSSGTFLEVIPYVNGNTLFITPRGLLSDGKYTLALHTGAVTDLAGNALALYSTGFTVDSIAPTMSKVDPVNVATKVAASKIIKVTFSEAIKLGGKFWVELKNSSGKLVPFKYSISGKVLTIDPSSNLAESKYSLVIHTGAVTDLAGNSFALKSSTFSVGKAPTVSKIDPANAATKVARNKVIKVTFNENIKASSNYWIELLDSKGKAVKISKSISGKVLTINHTKLAANAKYKLVIHTGAVTDIAGNPVAIRSFTFTTGNT